MESDFRWAGNLLSADSNDKFRAREFHVRGRRLRTTPVFEAYWWFAGERQRMFFRRLRGMWPATENWILAQNRFTNAYRASDRVSQYLIKRVIPNSAPDDRDIFFRTILFKLFNRIETWERLQETLGTIGVADYDIARYDRALSAMLERGDRIYSSAYIMPNPPFGGVRKHTNHLRLIDHMLAQRLPERLSVAKSLQLAYEMLREVPSFGPFLAFQFAIDLNYGSLLNFSEMDFVVAGPGSISGMRSCFTSLQDVSCEDIIRAVADQADIWFNEFGTDFPSLWHRPLQLIDCQNLFCEIDKYSRYAPELAGRSGRTRIKQKYRANGSPIELAYPQGWALRGEVMGVPAPEST